MSRESRSVVRSTACAFRQRSLMNCTAAIVPLLTLPYNTTIHTTCGSIPNRLIFLCAVLMQHHWIKYSVRHFWSVVFWVPNHWVRPLDNSVLIVNLFSQLKHKIWLPNAKSWTWLLSITIERHFAFPPDKQQFKNNFRPLWSSLYERGQLTLGAKFVLGFLCIRGTFDDENVGGIASIVYVFAPYRFLRSAITL